MANEKSNDLPLSFGVTESMEVKTMEYIVSRYLGNMAELSKADTLGSANPIKNYIASILEFLGSYTLSRGFIMRMTPEAATSMWLDLRKESDSIVTFLLHITSEFKMIYGPEEYRTICLKIAHANYYGISASHTFSIIKRDDELLANVLPTIKLDSVDDYVNFLIDNSWLVTIYLITLMNPIL